MRGHCKCKATTQNDRQIGEGIHLCFTTLHFCIQCGLLSTKVIFVMSWHGMFLAGRQDRDRSWLSRHAVEYYGHWSMVIYSFVLPQKTGNVVLGIFVKMTDKRTRHTVGGHNFIFFYVPILWTNLWTFLSKEKFPKKSPIAGNCLEYIQCKSRVVLSPGTCRKNPKWVPKALGHILRRSLPWLLLSAALMADQG